MNYAIIGFGAVGQALARAFARQGLAVAVAGRRPPDALTPLAREIGPTVVPTTLHDALDSETVILAVPFGEHRAVAQAAPNWQDKVVIDATNAFGIPVDQLGGRPSSVVVAEAFAGATIVKAFNHLPARTLAADPGVNGGRRVIFLASDDDAASTAVAALVEQLGFAPVKLGTLAEGGTLVQARDRTWAPLIFQDLIKVP